MEKGITLTVVGLVALLLVWGWALALAQSAEMNCIRGGLAADGRDWISKETVEWCIKTF